MISTISHTLHTARLYLATAFASLAATLYTLVYSRPATRPVRARAMTFIEYALLGAIIVVIAIIFRDNITDLINNLWNRINNAFNQTQ